MSDNTNSPMISATPDRPRERRPSSNGRPRSEGRASASVGVNFILAILVAGLIVAGWLLVNQQRKLAGADDALERASARLEVLEDRLRVTDQVMTASGEDTDEKLGYWESEIRKLWAVSNERNKQWIQQNQAAIAKHDKSVQSLLTQQQSMTESLESHEAAIVDRLAAMDVQLERLVAAQRGFNDKLTAQSIDVTALKGEVADRVVENANAIAAIDAYRVQVNKRLAELESRLVAGGASP